MPIRTLPNNLEAEESVLGACFLTKYAMQKAIESVSPEDFYDEKNQKIFKSIIELSDESTPLDLTTLTAKLQKKKELNEVGGVEYLTEVVNFVPTASNIDYYINIVQESSILRRLITTAEEIASDGYSTDETVNDILDNSEKKILDIVKNRSKFRILS